MKKLLLKAVTLLSLLTIPFLSGCNKDQEIIFGTMTTPGEPIVNHIKDKFEEKGYKLKVQIFGEFALGNPALVNKTIDVNLFQHTPYLNNYIESTQAKLSVAAELYYPIFGGYSNTITNFDQLVDGKKVTIPKDDSNRSRALRLLEANGIITLPADKNVVLLSDVTKVEGKNITIEEVEASLIGQAIKNKTTDLGILSNTYASIAGLSGDIQIVTESLEKQKTNVNILVVRTEDIKEPWLRDLVEILTSDDTKKFINEHFDGTLLPLFESKL